MTRTIGICSSSRSEKHLMEALVREMNSGKYDLKAELVDIALRNKFRDALILETKLALDIEAQDILIIPADRTEMCRFAYDCFIKNIPFCHMFSGSITYSYTHDDINRFLIALMANMCFAESPKARENLIRIGIPEDRILVTGTSHFDGITNYDIEANKPKDAPEQPYDLRLFNPTTQTNEYPLVHISFNKTITIKPNEDEKDRMFVPTYEKEYSHPEFLWLLKHCDHFISNSSAIHYEVPYLNKLCGANIKVVNPSIRNSIRTKIPEEYCRGASRIIAQWCQNVDLNWLKTPKRYPYISEDKLLGLPK